MPGADPAPGLPTRWFVAAVRRPLLTLGRLGWDLHITGGEHVPEPPGVIAANHLSFVDPVVVSLAAGRNIRYLAVASLFDQTPAFRRLISFFGAIPTFRQGVPIAAVRTALRALERGEPVGVFPEGRRVTRWHGDELRRGAAWLATAAGVPLVPVAIQGSGGTLSLDQPSLRCTPIRVWVEPPLDPLDFADHEDPVGALTLGWRRAVGRRLDPWVPTGR